MSIACETKLRPYLNSCGVIARRLLVVGVSTRLVAVPRFARLLRQLVIEESLSDQSVENARQEQREYVEENHIGEVVALICLAGQREDASLGVGMALVKYGLGRGQEEPRTAVDEGEYPDTHDDSLGAVHRAYLLGPHRVTDGDIPLQSERCDRQ